MVDLHIHTKFSDGSDNVEQIFKKILKTDIKIFSITDHDTIKGCKYLHNNLKQDLIKNNLKFINGVELSTRLNGRSIHILAYDFDINNKIIAKLIKEGQTLRKKRILKRIEILKSKFNIKISDEDYKKIIKMENAGRPHLAQILMKMGYAGNLNLPQEKFVKTVHACMQKYLYHSLEEFSLPSEYVIKQLKKANIISIIAHPLSCKFEKSKSKLTPKEFKLNAKILTKCGLDGLECFYSEYNSDDRALISSFAKENNLVVSAGSDYHGKHKKIKLGCLGFDIEKVDLNDITLLKLLNL